MPSHRAPDVAAPPILDRRAVLAVLAVVAAAVVVGLVLLWPGKVHGSGLGGQLVSGRVTATAQDCTNGCVTTATVRVTSGPDRGRSTTLTFPAGAADPRLRTGEHIRMNRSAGGYQFADIERGRPMLLLAVLFAVVVLIVGRLRGLAAMLGLGGAGVLLTVFVIPALIDGRSPTLVALVAGAAIALVVLPLAHGVSAATGAALLGTLAGMTLAALLSTLTVHALHFTGTSGDEAATLTALGSRSTVAGLLLCGVVIGALGVLNDVTVTQASAVFELAAADPTMPARGLFASAMRIGRDHIASTVYSLVLAYAGAALPLLLLFAVTDQSVSEVLTSDALGPEIVAGLVGATALVLMVPLTTALASGLAGRRPA